MGRQDVASDGEDSVWSRHLLEKIRVIWNCHELGEGWSPKYGMVGGLEQRHLEDDGLHAIVVPSAEGDREGDLADRSRAGTRDDAVEGLGRGDQLGHVKAHVLQGLGEDDIQGATTVDEHLCNTLI